MRVCEGSLSMLAAGMLMCGVACDTHPPGAARSAVLAAPGPASSFTLFESGQVRPLALSRDGQRLYAVNTPDNRLRSFVSIHQA